MTYTNVNSINEIITSVLTDMNFVVNSVISHDGSIKMYGYRGGFSFSSIIEPFNFHMGGKGVKVSSYSGHAAIGVSTPQKCAVTPILNGERVHKTFLNKVFRPLLDTYRESKSSYKIVDDYYTTLELLHPTYRIERILRPNVT